MNKYQSRIQLLSLFSIFFIYRAISTFLEGNALEFYLWLLITIIYLITLVVMYFVFKKSQKYS